MIFLGLFAIFQMQTLSELTMKLHAHPLTVSNAVRDVNINIVKMHRSMKDVALAQNEAALTDAIEAVNVSEQKVYEHLKVISAQFLGDQKDVERLQTLFVKWKPIRDEVIALMRQNRRNEAAMITKNKGAQHVEHLSAAMKKLTDFANQKGLDFLANAQHREAQLSLWVYAVMGTIIFVSGGVAVFMARAISRSFQSAVGVANAIADGNLNNEIEVKSRDEAGQLLQAFASMQDRLSHQLEEVDGVIQAAYLGDFNRRIGLKDKSGFFKSFGDRINKLIKLNQTVLEEMMYLFSALAQGDLSQKIENDYGGMFEQLREDANGTITRLREIVVAIQEAMQVLISEAAQLSQGNVSLSQRTEQQATSLEKTAASMKQMTSTVQQNAENAKQANQLTISAKERAEKGGEVMGMTILAMGEISHSSKRITEIIGVIDEIAFQTNLLALNASVEAARAGEQGRGFAVVAAEVRSLAQRSTAAAKEIKVLIQDSVAKVEEGMRSANESGEALQEMVSAVKGVDDIIAEIAAASREQSSGIEQVNKAVSQMDEMTQQNASLVEEAAVGSESMTEQVRFLQEKVAFFYVDERGEATRVSERLPINRASATVSDAGPASELGDYDDGDWEEF